MEMALKSYQCHNIIGRVKHEALFCCEIILVYSLHLITSLGHRSSVFFMHVSMKTAN